MHKICLFDVTASHYRSEIFKSMDNTFDIDFYFGNMMPSIKTMDVHVLSGYKETLNVKKVGPLFWYDKMLSIVIKEYDTIIFDGDYRCLSTWIALLLCKCLNKRAYIWTHGFYGKERGLKSLIKFLFVRLCTGCLIYGDYAKMIMVNDYKIPKTKLYVVHNSLDYTTQSKIRRTLKHSTIYSDHFNNNYPTIIFIGRLTAVKKLEMIICAQKLLKEKGIDINVVIVGEGPQRESLVELVDKYCLKDMVWFFGASYDENVNAELLYNADICVSPGNIGLTAIHSLTYGTPAITHDYWSEQMPEFEAIKKGKTGDFFEYGSVNSLANVIENWLLKHQSREEVRNNCFQIIDDEWNPMYQLKILKKVINDDSKKNC